jgi:recombinational DNA repair ATPase RecF
MEDIFIKSIHINKVRHLENVEIPISETERKHLILTGKNGSGKTSVLLEIKNWLSEHTGLKTVEGENIRERLIDDMVKFTKQLNKYSKPTISSEDRERYRKKIREMLSVKSPFTAFKVWVIKSNPYLLNEFALFLPQ